METSSPNNTLSFSPFRILWSVAAALILSLVLYWAFRLPDRAVVTESGGASDLEVQAEQSGDAMIGVQPASFQQISEYREGGLNRLQLSGNAEADAVIILTNRGERLRQVRVDELGHWNAAIDVESEGMAIVALLYTDESLPGVQSEETIFYLPVSAVEDASTVTYTNSALIMVTAPGTPSQIIQSPFGGVPTAGPLSLSVIDYDHSGGVIITGSSSIPGRIRIYAQDSVIGETGIGVSGRWNYIAGRILPLGEVELRVELIAAQGIPDAPEDPIFISVPFKLLSPLQSDQTDDSAALSVNIEPDQWWQVRRTLIGGGGQSTVIFAPQAAE